MGVVILWIVLMVVMSVGADAVIAEQRPAYLGFACAYPSPESEFGQRLGGVSVPYDSLRLTILRIGKSGEVEGFVPVDTSDTTLDAALVQYLADTKFEPARLDGEKISSLFGVLVFYRPDGIRPRMTFSVDTNMTVVDRDLYELTLRLNDVNPPTIRHFPSVHASVGDADSSAVYPWVLMRLDLDSTGRPVAIDTVRSDLPYFTPQYRSACNWAEYTPATVRGNARAVRLYVLLRLFKGVVYPTREIYAAARDSLPMVSRMAVSAIIDTIGLMSKPIPRNVSSGEVRLTGSSVGVSDVRALCEVNPEGSIRALRIGTTVSRRITEYRQMIRIVRLYPALDFTGRPVRYFGPVHMSSDLSGIIRINFLWLPEDGTLYSP